MPTRGNLNCSPYKPLSQASNVFPFPSFNDLGKQCKELFDKNYNLGQFVINVKNKTCHGVEITTKGAHNHEDKKASGKVNVKAVYPFMEGLSTQHKWDTDNNFKNEVTLQDVFLPGLKLSTEVVLKEDTMETTGAVRVQLKHSRFTADAAFDATDAGKDKEGSQQAAQQLIGGSIVTGHKGLMGALKFDYDINSKELKSHKVGFAYQNKDYNFHLAYKSEDKQIVEGFFYHKISREVEVGAKAKYGDDDGPEYAIGGRYMFNGYGHAFRARVNNKSLLGVAFECTVVPGFQAIAAGEVDLTKFSEGGHKIGFGLDFGMGE